MRKTFPLLTWPWIMPQLIHKYLCKISQYKYTRCRIQNILFVCLLVFNATFNNISVILWRSVLLVEETGVPGENHDLSQVTDKIYPIMLHTSLIEIRTYNISGDRHWLLRSWPWRPHNMNFSWSNMRTYSHIALVVLLIL